MTATQNHFGQQARGHLVLVCALLAVPLVSSCSFSDKVDNAAQKICGAEAVLARDPTARTSAEPDVWCSTGNIRGTDVCFDGHAFFVRVTGPFLSLDGWFLSK